MSGWYQSSLWGARGVGSPQRVKRYCHLWALGSSYEKLKWQNCWKLSLQLNLNTWSQVMRQLQERALLPKRLGLVPKTEVRFSEVQHSIQGINPSFSWMINEDVRKGGKWIYFCSELIQAGVRYCRQSTWPGDYWLTIGLLSVYLPTI